jgi:ferredoxin-NADP reductase
MAGATPPERLDWQLATVVELVSETARAVSIVLELPEFPGHWPGQHVDLRLMAWDGGELQRRYAIASAPEDGYLVLTLERLEHGEVSSQLADGLRAGDQLELRGPIGRSFVWEPTLKGPVLLVAGGPGIVPFRSMLRHRGAISSCVRVRLLYAARSLEDVIYREELMRLAAYDEVDVRLALTRESPPAWRGHRGRINRELLAEVSWPARERPMNFVCGPNGFVESIAHALAQNNHPPHLIRSERFGPMRH